MRTPRFYNASPLIPDSEIALTDEVFHHAVRVLRLRGGDHLLLFDGSGREFNARLGEITRRSATAHLDGGREYHRESPLHISLWQGISRGERMDYALQKAVELGVNRIVPLITHRAQSTRRGEQLSKRLQHWQGVLIAACEQSGRNHLPELLPAQSLDHGLQEAADGTRLLLDPLASVGLREQPPPRDARLMLLIGPEGGLSDEETHQAYAAGFSGVRLGPRILRTETATAAALSAIQTLWGDLG